MHDNDEYQGWTNYNTWCVNLWLTNDHGTYDHIEEMKKRIKESESRFTHAVWNEQEYIRFVLSDKIKEMVDDQFQESTIKDMFHDLINAVLSDVNWLEIADAVLEE